MADTKTSENTKRLLLKLPDELTRRDGCPFDPPSGLTRLNDGGGLHRVTTVDGERIWLATGHETVRALFADPRMSSDRSRSERLMSKLSDEVRARLLDEKARAGGFIGMDAPEHTRYRRLLTGQFTVRRMKQLAPRIEEIVTDHLDAMVAAGPPADLVPAFALPVPSLVICELLGVAYEDRAHFQERSARLLNLNVPLEDALAALDDLRRFMHDLVLAKRARPTDDILSGLIASDASLTDDELAGIANLLLVAGHETTANMLALGTFTLLEHPTSWPRCGPTRRWSPARSRNCCGTCRSSTSASCARRSRTSRSATRSSRRATSCRSPSRRPTGTAGTTPTPTPSTCTGRGVRTWRSGTASTSASGSSSRGSR